MATPILAVSALILFPLAVYFWLRNGLKAALVAGALLGGALVGSGLTVLKQLEDLRAFFEHPHGEVDLAVVRSSRPVFTLTFTNWKLFRRIVEGEEFSKAVPPVAQWELNPPLDLDRFCDELDVAPPAPAGAGGEVVRRITLNVDELPGPTGRNIGLLDTPSGPKDGISSENRRGRACSNLVALARLLGRAFPGERAPLLAASLIRSGALDMQPRPIAFSVARRVLPILPDEIVRGILAPVLYPP